VLVLGSARTIDGAGWLAGVRTGMGPP
jgi:hypothetical protein